MGSPLEISCCAEAFVFGTKRRLPFSFVGADGAGGADAKRAVREKLLSFKAKRRSWSG